MASRVAKAGTLRFKPGAKAGQSSGTERSENDPPSRATSSVRASVEPRPVVRRASISANANSNDGTAAPSSPSPSTIVRPASKSIKSYAVGSSAAAKSSTGGVPIFVGSGAHSHAQANKRASMGPPPSLTGSRRSQTPQTQPVQSNGFPTDTSSQPPTITTSSGVEDEGETKRTSPIPAKRTLQPPPEHANKAQKRAVRDTRIVVEVTPPSTKRGDGVGGSETQRLQKGKAKAAPRKPGNPPTAYVLFSKEARPRIVEEAGTVNGASFDINARVRKEWLELNAEQKKRFEDEAARKKQIWQSMMDDWTAQNPKAAALELDTKGKKRSNSVKSGTKEPVPPAMDAYEYYEKAVLERGDLGGEVDVRATWDALTEDDRLHYVLEAQEAEEQYIAEMEEWDREQQASSKPSKRKEKTRTVSDDEAEYLAEVAQHGPDLKSRRVDSRSTAMTDLSTAAFNRGRASKRTFDMERKLKASIKERQQSLKEQKAARAASREGDAATATSRVNNVARQDNDGTTEHRRVEKRAESSQFSEPEEEIIDEGDGGGESDAESVGATSIASSHRHPLRDNRFTVRTRIVNGQIVLDESSLQQERSNDASMDGVGQEYIDVNEDDRFVNSATYSKRTGSERWDARETQEFLKAVSMWGSDFEMISRMFSNRNRKQIRAKWRSMERTDGHSLDLAFRRKLPVNLEEYGLLAGVDLSGEAPKIQARIIKKAEEEEGQEEERVAEGEKEQRQAERDENGYEIVEEGGGEEEEEEQQRGHGSRRSVVRKKSATPARMAKSKSPSIVGTDLEEEEEDENEEDEEQLPTAEEAMRLAVSKSPQGVRAQSTSSATATINSHRPRSSSAAVANATEAERLRLAKKQQDLQRKERERSRRRSVPNNEEEVID